MHGARTVRLQTKDVMALRVILGLAYMQHGKVLGVRDSISVGVKDRVQVSARV